MACRLHFNSRRCASQPSRRSLVVRAAATPLPSKFSSVKPSGDRVVVKVGAAEAKTAGGILLPTAAESDKNEGTVVAVGTGESIKEGDEVLYSRYAGTHVKVGEDEQIIMKEADVIGIKGASMSAMKPTEDRILIRVAEDEVESSGGVILTAQSAEKPNIGEVVAVGPGRKGEDGEMQVPKCSAGAQVLYSKYSGVELEEDGVQFVVVRETDLLAVLS
eukprot:jgi/Ulvmu1/11121/UM071_0004.1